MAEEEQRNAWLFGILSAVLAVIAPVLPILVFLWVRKARRKEIPQEIHLPDHIYELPEDMTLPS